MNKDKIIYWISTGLVSLMMLLSAYMYLTSAEVIEMFAKIGFPSFFRQELAVAKIIGALVLLIPQIPTRVKEWAYAGFGIVFVSAAYTHLSIGDPAAKVITPLVFFGILIVSYVYLNKSKAAAV